MPRPSFTSSISLGNVIQVLLLIVGLTGGYFAIKHESATAFDLATKTASSLQRVEGRVTQLEIGAASDNAQLKHLQDDLKEIKDGQRELNNLIRELLRRDGN